MLTLTNLPKIVGKRKKRVGRGAGSGVGAKSTRGTKRHQKAREKIKIWFEGGQNRMIKKFPLLRGKARNKSVAFKPQILNLDDLAKIPSGAEVDLETLMKHDIVSETAIKTGVKVLSAGTLPHPLIVKIPASANARKKIEAVGGKVV